MRGSLLRAGLADRTSGECLFVDKVTTGGENKEKGPLKAIDDAAKMGCADLGYPKKRVPLAARCTTGSL